MLGAATILVVFVTGQVFSTSIFTSNSTFNTSDFDFTNEELIEQIKTSTASLTSLYNNKEGIFLWNVQNPQNLSRYGNLADITNGEESLDQLDYNLWLEGCAQDIAMQYLLLKNYVYVSLQFMGDIQEYYEFNREWIYMTAQIVDWIDRSYATDDTMINILDIFSEKSDGFGEYWNILIRPKYNPLIEETLSLLGDTLVLGSKILRAVEFMPYFSNYEKVYFLSIAERVSDWWVAINDYALYDPSFAIAGIDQSKISTEYEDWIGWFEFKKKSFKNEFNPVDITASGYLDFQKYLYTSPQLADQYLTYIEKASTMESYMWDNELVTKDSIKNPFLYDIYNMIVDNYSEHIQRVRNKVVYIFDPTNDISWTALQYRFSGYSYLWDKYFVDTQGSETDLYEYRIDSSPLKLTGLRTYQGAGDIRGLMDVYNVLTHGFNPGGQITGCEIASMDIIAQILKSQREDRAFVFSPYFGTSLDVNILQEPIINDAKLCSPMILPSGLDVFTGSLSVYNFLLEVKEDLASFGYHSDLSSLKVATDNTIRSLTDFITEKINPTTQGIAKQSIIGNTIGVTENMPLYTSMKIQIAIDLSPQIFEEKKLPTWIMNHNIDLNKAYAEVNQWNYLQSLYKAFLLFEEPSFVASIFNSFQVFYEDFIEDQQYQLLAICEVKDAIARTFFIENLADDIISLNDRTGIYGNSIPFYYRSEVSPVTRAFAAETPQKVSVMVLSILPILESFLEIISNPINQVVIVGFVTGLVLTIAVVYIRRPKN